jgi:hypothetical protein
LLLLLLSRILVLLLARLRLLVAFPLGSRLRLGGGQFGQLRPCAASASRASVNGCQSALTAGT